MSRRARLVAVAGAALALALVAWPAGAGPASAHATVLGTNPQNGAELKESPAGIRITFDESVTLPPQGDAAGIVNEAGARVDAGTPALEKNRTVLVIPVKPDLPKGTYIASWSVVSADTHPVGGSIQFGVRTPAIAAAAPDSRQPSAGLELAAGLAKGAVYLGLVIGLGLLPAALVLGAAGTSSTVGRSRRTSPASARAVSPVPGLAEQERVELAPALVGAAVATGGSATLTLTAPPPGSPESDLVEADASAGGTGASADRTVSTHIVTAAPADRSTADFASDRRGSVGAASSADGSERSTVARVVRAGLVFTIVASVVQLAVQYLWDASTAPADAPAWSGILPFAGSAYAVALYVRVVALVLAAVVLPGPRASGRDLLVRTVAFTAFGLVAVGAIVHNGHGGSSWWQFLSTLLHASSAVAWIGGLVVLGWLLLRQRLSGERLQRLPWWSLYAAGCVLLLVLSGVLQSIVEVRYPAALVTTPYGILLLVKLGLVAVVLVLALQSHFWVRARLRESAAVAPNSDSVDGRPAPGQTARLRRRVRWEAGVAAVVVVISGVLSSITPAEASYAPVVSETRSIGPYTVTIEGGPARTGPQSFRVTAVGASASTPLPRSVQLQLSDADGTVRGLDVQFPYRIADVLHPGTPTAVHFSSATITLPRSGEWTATVTVVADRFDQYSADVRYEVQ